MRGMCLTILFIVRGELRQTNDVLLGPVGHNATRPWPNPGPSAHCNGRFTEGVLHSFFASPISPECPLNGVGTKIKVRWALRWEVAFLCCRRASIRWVTEQFFLCDAIVCIMEKGNIRSQGKLLTQIAYTDNIYHDLPCILQNR